MATTPAVHQVNLLALLLPLPHQEQGDYLASTGDEVKYDMRETSSFTRKLEKHKLCLSTAPPPTTTTTPNRRSLLWNDEAYSLLQTTMEPLPHGLWSCLPASH